MEINDAMNICFKNKIKVYPVIENRRQKVAVSFNDKKPKVFDTVVSGKELNEALTKTYIFYANKLTKNFKELKQL